MTWLNIFCHVGYYGSVYIGHTWSQVVTLGIALPRTLIIMAIVIIDCHWWSKLICVIWSLWSHLVTYEYKWSHWSLARSRTSKMMALMVIIWLYSNKCPAPSPPNKHENLASLYYLLALSQVKRVGPRLCEPTPWLWSKVVRRQDSRYLGPSFLHIPVLRTSGYQTD